MEAGVPPPAAPAESTHAGAYPIRYSVEYKEQHSRATTIFRCLLVIPQTIVLAIVGLIALIAAVICWFAIVFTGSCSRSLLEFITNVMRWSVNVNAYLYLLRDEYPPFGGEPGQYPVTFEVELPEGARNRLTVLLRAIWVFPQLVVLGVVGILNVLVIVQWFSIVFTGKCSRGIFDLLVGVQRWQARVSSYYLLLTDEYPPFSLN